MELQVALFVEHQLQQSKVSELTNDVWEEFAVVTLVGAVQEDGVAILSDVLQIGGFVGVEVAASGHVNLLDSLRYPDSFTALANPNNPPSPAEPRPRPPGSADDDRSVHHGGGNATN